MTGPDGDGAASPSGGPGGSAGVRGSAGPVTPGGLRAGDRVAVVAPSGPVDAGRLGAGVAWLRGLGLEVTLGAHVHDRRGFLAGDDAARAADLQDAWCDPDVSAVLCARGGYGAVRVLGHLDWTALAAAGPKLLHGSSDITALHAAFGARLGAATSFGPMVAGLLADPDPATAASARGALCGAPAPVTGGHALVPGRVAGPLTGGNLSLLVSLLATPYAPPPARGRVVLLEDVTEAPYRIDRMLTQLLLAGWFDGAAGVALGSWTDCGDPGELYGVLAERLGGLGVPVAAGLPIGHGAPQHTVMLGAEAVLDADSGTLTPAGHGAAGSGPPAPAAATAAATATADPVDQEPGGTPCR